MAIMRKCFTTGFILQPGKPVEQLRTATTHISLERALSATEDLRSDEPD